MNQDELFQSLKSLEWRKSGFSLNEIVEHIGEKSDAYAKRVLSKQLRNIGWVHAYCSKEILKKDGLKESLCKTKRFFMPIEDAEESVIDVPCGICGVMFTSLDALEVHVKEHYPVRTICVQCLVNDGTCEVDGRAFCEDCKSLNNSPKLILDVDYDNNDYPCEDSSIESVPSLDSDEDEVDFILTNPEETVSINSGQIERFRDSLDKLKDNMNEATEALNCLQEAVKAYRDIEKLYKKSRKLIRKLCER